MTKLKIFEHRVYSDGGIGDRGYTEGWILANSSNEIREHLNLQTGYDAFYETTIEEFLQLNGAKILTDMKKVPTISSLEIGDRIFLEYEEEIVTVVGTANGRRLLVELPDGTELELDRHVRFKLLRSKNK